MIIATSLGLEVIGRDLRIAVVRVLFGKLRLKQSLVITGFLDLPEEDRRRSLVDIVRKNKIGVAAIFLSLPNDLGVVRQLEFPVEVREKLKSVVALQIEALSPWPADEMYWDVACEEPRKGAKTLLATVGIVPRAVLDPWMTFFKSAGLPLSGAGLSAVTCAHGVVTIWNSPSPTIVLGCEADYVEGALISGTRFVSVTCKGSETEQLLRSTVQRLVSAGRLDSAEKARVVAYGSTAEALESAGPVEIPIENASRDAAGSFGAISAALMAIKRSAFSTNVIPPPLRFRRSRLQLIPTYVLAAAAVLMGVTMLLREPYQNMIYGARIDDEIRKVASDAGLASVQETELNRLSEKYRALAGHFQSRDYNLETLKELSRVLPQSAWVSAYSYRDGSFTISGFAESASEIQRLIEDSPLFKDAQFTSSVMRDSSGKDRFSLKANIEVAK